MREGRMVKEGTTDEIVSSHSDGGSEVDSAQETPRKGSCCQVMSWSPLPLSPSLACGGGKQLQRLSKEFAEWQKGDQVLGRALLVDESAPVHAVDLGVQKKKVDQFRDWLKRHSCPPQGCLKSRVLLLTGPSGSCKHALVNVISKEMSYDICAWKAPVPILWSERESVVEGHHPYTSKLDAFEQFIMRAKYPSLNLTKRINHRISGGLNGFNHTSNKLVVIDDLPHVQSQESRFRVVNALRQLAAFAQHPAICILSDACPHPDERKQDSVSKEHHFHEEIRRALQECGSEHIALPPVNKTNTLRALRRACQLGGLDAHAECIEKVSAESNGNLKSSLQMLQMAMVGLWQEHSRRTTPVKGRGKRKRQSVPTKHPLITQQLAQDQYLASFHALGKILYNKRKEDCGKGKGHVGSQRLVAFSGVNGSGEITVDNHCGSIKDKYLRPPSQYNAEDIVARSGLEASQLCSFLGEHYLNFFQDSCLEEAFLAAQYLSDADVLSYGKYLREASSMDLSMSSSPSRPLLDAVSESVAARGVMFANSCPSTSKGLYKFHGPRCRPVRQARIENVREANRVILDSSLLCTQNSFILDFLPMFRQLGNWKDLTGLMPSIWASEDGGLVERKGVANGGLNQSIGLHCGKLYHCETDKFVDHIED